jgi:hypothetical protein
VLATLAGPGATKFGFASIRESVGGPEHRDETIIMNPFTVALVEPKFEEAPDKAAPPKPKKKTKQEEDEYADPTSVKLKLTLTGVDVIVDDERRPAPAGTVCEAHTFCTLEDIAPHLAAARKAGTAVDAGKAVAQARRAYPIDQLHNMVAYVNAQGLELITIEVDDDVPVEIVNAIVMVCTAKTAGVPHKDRETYLKARKKPRDEPLFINVALEVPKPVMPAPIGAEGESPAEKAAP